MHGLYKYHLRPGFKSKNLLIEVFHGINSNEPEKFIAEITKALAEINPIVTDITDLWMNDETIYCFTSNDGDFNLSIDVWGFAFIMADNNQNVIKTIDFILHKNEIFEKVEVDFNDYK